MNTVSSAFDGEIRKLIADRIDEVKDDMAAGHMVPEVYARAAGEIRGLRLTLEFCDTAASNINKR